MSTSGARERRSPHSMRVCVRVRVCMCERYPGAKPSACTGMVNKPFGRLLNYNELISLMDSHDQRVVKCFDSPFVFFSSFCQKEIALLSA